MLAVAMTSAMPASAADPRYPDWPCAQIKVPEISLAAVWSGPSIEGIGNAWQKDPKVSELVTQLAARRTPLEEAEKQVTAFITGDPRERQEKAKLLFAGLFNTLNRERGEVMNGIERYFRKQKEFAAKIRDDTQKMRDLQDAPSPDQAKVDEMGGQLEWETRIFDERRHTISYVCEVPVLIERRLFALGRTIQQALE
jgi:hypothetical protein